MIIDCISDLHGYYPELDGGDLLIIAGDLTARDRPEEYDYFLNWIEHQKYKKIVFIAGNHDNFMKDWEPSKEPIDNLKFDLETRYLCDSGTEFEYEEEIEEDHKFKGIIKYKQKKKLKIWGSPWSLWFDGINPKCKTFTGSENDLKKKFDLIPDDTDILITHSPPYGILDSVKKYCYNNPRDYDIICAGSKSLGLKVGNITPPKLWAWGHIHESYGEAVSRAGCRMINCSYVNERYEPVNKPIRIIL